VGQDHAEPSTSLEDEAETFPQWGIAVLVIGLAAIAFVVIFGVSMVIQDLHIPSFPHKNRRVLKGTVSQNCFASDFFKKKKIYLQVLILLHKGVPKSN
jgi:hypothetical protein